MLSNAYFLAKFRFDTAENEPAKNLQNFGKFANIANYARSAVDACPLGVGLQLLGPAGASGLYEHVEGGGYALWKIFGKISAKIRSFSDVSAPIFARNTHFAAFSNLPDYLAEFFEICIFCKLCNICKKKMNFHENC